MPFLKVAIILVAVVVGLFLLSQAPNLVKKIGVPTYRPEAVRITPSQPIQKKQAVISRPSVAATSTPPAPIAATSAPVYLPHVSDSQIPLGFKREQLSPYFKKVRISSAYPSVGISQIRLYSDLAKDESANITGWRLKSNLSELIIPQAVEVHNPFGALKDSDIILPDNNYVYIYSNKSPIGKNFQLNKCVGYMQNTAKFEPDLPQNCPAVYKSRAEITYLAGYCQNYITSLSRCKLPDANTYNSFPGTVEGNACRAYLNTISYGNCFQKYRNDSDFLSKEWRLWVNQKILDSQHDRVRLFDKQDLLVDEYIY